MPYFLLFFISCTSICNTKQEVFDKVINLRPGSKKRGGGETQEEGGMEVLTNVIIY